ncbi:MAG: DUF4105 domain-containing protein [Treponema sp.]|nr:DUF4105 domain-containing protein [Treponema sp.]
MINRKAFLIVLMLLLSSVILPAQGENLTVKIAVMGPGNEVYFWWGHIALIIEDSITGRSRFYDYGIFSFDNENFYYNFAFGRMLYSSGVSSTENNIAAAINRDRSIVIYTLDLPPETRVMVRDFVENNVLPENRDYYYHHFRDNCSTRIRDIIDLATGGQFKEQYGQSPGRFTLREQVRRHTWFSPVVDWILNFWMGQVIDTTITEWDDMFLPSETGARIDSFFYTDIHGARRKLVSDAQTIHRSENRPAALDTPRRQWPGPLVFSIALSAIFYFFFFLNEKKFRAGRVLAGISMSIAGLVFGIAGVTLYFLVLFTNHDYTFQNYNMIFCTPFLLASFPIGICYAFTKKNDKLIVYDRLLRLIWFISVMGIVISMLIKLLPGFYQQNLADQLLMLPIALVFSLHSIRFRDFINKFSPGARSLRSRRK